MVAILPFTFSVIPCCTTKDGPSVRMVQLTGKGVLGKGVPPISPIRVRRLGLPKSKSGPRWATLECTERLRSHRGNISVGSHLSQHLLSRFLRDYPSGADGWNQDLLRLHGSVGEITASEEMEKRESPTMVPPFYHAISHWVHVY